MGLAELVKGEDAPAELDLGLAEEPEAKPNGAAPKEPEVALGVEADDEGKPKAIPLGRFNELNEKRKGAEKRAAELEAQLESARSDGKDVREAFKELYGKFENPLEYMRDDAMVAQSLWELREDPEVKRVLAKVQKHLGGSTRVTERAETTETKTEPAADPRAEQLIQDRVRDRAESILTEAKVRPELHGPILQHVLAQTKDPSREAVRDAIKEYAQAQKWTNEFLRGTPAKKGGATPLPNPTGLSASTPRKDDKPTGEKTPDRPRSLSQIQDMNRAMLRDKLAQHGLS